MGLAFQCLSHLPNENHFRPRSIGKLVRIHELAYASG